MEHPVSEEVVLAPGAWVIWDNILRVVGSDGIVIVFILDKGFEQGFALGASGLDVDS